jgi:hypothetical protein
VLIAVACVMASVVVTQPANAETGYSVPIRSGHSWASGIYSTNATGQAEAVGTWRGAPIDTMQFWPARAKWSDFVTPVYGALTGKSYVKVLGIPMIPEGGSTLTSCAAGSYNKYWTQFATSLQTNGIQNSTIVRLGWEFNGDWYVWKATNQTAFATCWRQIVKTIRAVTPNVKFDWNVIRGSSPGAPGDTIMQTYPGNDVVDIVGVDSYDWWRTWEQQLNDKWGLNFWLQFAKDHGKKLSVPEWGLMPSSRHGKNDNPGYIQHMFNFFKKNASYIAYEQYFNSYSNCACQIYPSSTYPNSSALYASLW